MTVELGEVRYEGGAPAAYVCGSCGAAGCKLWRGYHQAARSTTLECVDCAGNSQRRDVSDVDADGRRLDDGDRTDQIGCRIPAVPKEDGSTFWSYMAVPYEGVRWWRRLPTRAAR